MIYNKNYYKKEKRTILKRSEIVCFWKEMELNGYLSQWYNSKIIVDGISYLNAEQYMMAQKAKLFGDEKIFNEIMKKDTPREFKKLGRLIKNFDDDIWNREKINIVLKGNIHKFSQNEKLKKLLLDTGDKILIEASPYDDIWGVKLREIDSSILNINAWKGENLLGFILMEVRDYLKSST